MVCLNDEPEALDFFKNLAPSHQRYFSNWIESAKTEATETKRIALTVTTMIMKKSFSEMMRSS